jgi:hypothetical protein
MKPTGMACFQPDFLSPMKSFAGEMLLGVAFRKVERILRSCGKR